MCVFDGDKRDNDPFRPFRVITQDAQDMGEDPAGWMRDKKIGEPKEDDGLDWLRTIISYMDVNILASANHAVDPAKLPLDGKKPATPKQNRWAMLGTDNAR